MRCLSITCLAFLMLASPVLATLAVSPPSLSLEDDSFVLMNFAEEEVSFQVASSGIKVNSTYGTLQAGEHIVIGVEASQPGLIAISEADDSPGMSIAPGIILKVGEPARQASVTSPPLKVDDAMTESPPKVIRKDISSYVDRIFYPATVIILIVAAALVVAMVRS